jgi:hypothetical protein
MEQLATAESVTFTIAQPAMATSPPPQPFTSLIVQEAGGDLRGRLGSMIRSEQTSVMSRLGPAASQSQEDGEDGTETLDYEDDDDEEEEESRTLSDEETDDDGDDDALPGSDKDSGSEAPAGNVSAASSESDEQETPSGAEDVMEVEASEENRHLIEIDEDEASNPEPIGADSEDESLALTKAKQALPQPTSNKGKAAGVLLASARAIANGNSQATPDPPTAAELLASLPPGFKFTKETGWHCPCKQNVVYTAMTAKRHYENCQLH